MATNTWRASFTNMTKTETTPSHTRKYRFEQYSKMGKIKDLLGGGIGVGATITTITKMWSLTLSVHAQESYSSHLSLSVCVFSLDFKGCYFLTV